MSNQYDLDDMECKFFNSHVVIRRKSNGAAVEFWHTYAIRGETFLKLREWKDSPQPLVHMTHWWLQSTWNALSR